ncbi:MAG: small acid-soluble spore protein SspI [Bacillota bacterium]|jgi:small acid-soluble spore protein I (minor)
MNFNIRTAIVENLTGMTQQELGKLINDSATGEDEKFLPGLGVVFELLWQSSTANERQDLLAKVHTSLKKG